MKKILVVDDDEGIREVVTLILSQEGFRVETAQNSDEVIKKAFHFHPELILLDILLSEDDGRNICQELKSQDDLNFIPIVMMSAYPSAENTVIHCGADGFIAKPFLIEDLLNMVHKYMKY